jgi:SAM-dependent methyltransferase
MNQQWLIEHVLENLDNTPESPSNGRSFLTCERAEQIVDQTLEHLGAHGDETEYTYMRGHRARLIHALTMIPMAEDGRDALLDVGCYGYMGYWATRHLGYNRVVGIEWHPEVPESVITRELGIGEDRVTFDSHNIDITTPEWGLHEQFDTVLFFEVLEHINVDPMSVMERINSATKLGGSLVMSVPNAVSYKTLREFLVGMPPWTYWFFEPDLSHEPRHSFEYTPIVFQSVLAASGMSLDAFRTIYAYTQPENEKQVLEVADSLGFDQQSFGETMIALSTKTREGVPLRYPDALYSPDGYYKNIYPKLQSKLTERLNAIRAHHVEAEAAKAKAEALIEYKPLAEAEIREQAAQIETLKQQIDELTQDRDQHKDWAGNLYEKERSLESQVTQLLFQNDCWMQRELELSTEIALAHQTVADTSTETAAKIQAAEQDARDTRAWADSLAQENADLKTQVDQLLFACDCYLQQINDPDRCAQVIRQRRFRWALDRSKAIARKTPVARTVLRPVYRGAKKAIKRRM